MKINKLFLVMIAALLITATIYIGLCFTTPLISEEEPLAFVAESYAVGVDPSILYLETDTAYTTSGQSASALWNDATLGNPTFAEVFVKMEQSVVGTVSTTLQVSPDNANWYTHNTAFGDDVDDDSAAGAIITNAITDTNAYWNGMIQGRYVRVSHTTAYTTPRWTATSIVILH